MITFTLNGSDVSLDTDPQTPLLWALRDNLQLTGTKFGCGMGLCGACTVHLDGTAVRSCSLPLEAVAGKAVTTIEGLGGKHPLQQAWVAHNVPQCGYCQSGQIMSAAALLAANPAPDEEAVRQAMAGNLCRCGTYHKVQRAILSVAAVAHWEPSAEADS
ncbi:(2Fe-2S)-binding protein [Haliea sp. E1-2-M8]|uniref:(2Fe-2S)-binding protein n=1 Tax=Haliea sp. E1-2-M8 TaxID=3064706 RepID=UPI0027264F45|nr:(2Fe-2S)-binding protein [Haliea sp. E1-2-M8]MDO8861894.1 (2Fe-2S)-binding protein [Haliea sp. E1-2-M8]